MSDVRHQTNSAANQVSTEEEVKCLAMAGEIRLAVEAYHAIHNVGLKDALNAVNQLAGLPQVSEKVGSVSLGSETLRRVEILFPPRERAEVSRLLIEKCGEKLPHPGKIINVYQPAGQMVELFRDAPKWKGLPSREDVVNSTYTAEQIDSIHE